MSIKVTFPGNKKVDAQVGAFTVHTDQAAYAGGDGTAPSPFELFLASIATCAGIFIVGFCENRGLSTENITIEQEAEFDSVNKRLAKVKMHINVPEDFPAKYHSALISSANLCLVKRTLMNPPEFEIDTVVK